VSVNKSLGKYDDAHVQVGSSHLRVPLNRSLLEKSNGVAMMSCIVITLRMLLRPRYIVAIAVCGQKRVAG
jgi:hypothetical protein